MKSLEILARKWASKDIGAFSPYGQAIVRATFLAAGIEPSSDLIRLYGLIGGMEVHDDTLWRLWPLSDVDDRIADANESGCCFRTICSIRGPTA